MVSEEAIESIGRGTTIRGFVDDISLHDKMLHIRGWAVDEHGRMPTTFSVNLKGQDIWIEKFSVQRRRDVQDNLALSHDAVGFLFEVEAGKIVSLNDIGPTVEVYCGNSKDAIFGPLKITQKVANRIVYNRHVLISCLFGEKFSRIYQAIPGRCCVFFSNNPNLEEEAVSKGWLFRLVTDDSLSPSYKISSIQSKKIKFLQFIEEFTEFKEVEVFTYFDHKFAMKEKHILWILNNTPPNASVLIRNTAGKKTCIEHEIIAAMRQKRYADSMDATITWLDRMRTERGISEKVRICNTGLIHYQNLSIIAPMLREIYTAVHTQQQPECQILWAAVSQSYEEMIHTVEWRKLTPLWETP